MVMWNWIGWIATATFAVSYLCKNPQALRRVQALAALLWIAYGLRIRAAPVVVANLVVAVLAICSSMRGGRPNSYLPTGRRHRSYVAEVQQNVIFAA
jgi:hypothetical protein